MELTRQQIEQFLDVHISDINSWKKDDQERYTIAYWHWHNKKEYRVFEVGSSLEEVATKCLQEEANIKAGRPKVLKPPAPPAPPPMLTCFSCGYSQQHGPVCNACGCPI